MYLATIEEVRAALAAAGLEAGGCLSRPDRIVVTAAAGEQGRALERLQAVFGRTRAVAGDRSLVGRVAASLKETGGSLALAESCTGGLVCKLLTDLPGSSAFLLGGVVAYANEAKVRLLGVPAGVLACHGAVSAAVVEAMARGAAQAFGALYAAAISGIAGPDGGTPDKPVGTVWVAACGPGDDVESRSFLFAGDRARVREQAALQALLMVVGRVRSQVRQAGDSY